MTDIPVTKADDDLKRRAIEHSAKYGMAGVGSLMLVAFAEQETEALRAQLAAAEAMATDYALQAMQARNSAIEDKAATEAKLQAMRKALEEIAEGRGRYSQDHYEHACNTIEDMKELAREAIRSLTEGKKHA